jgi:membrane-associated protease RseP (regulator of RpoE activity)
VPARFGRPAVGINTAIVQGAQDRVCHPDRPRVLTGDRSSSRLVAQPALGGKWWGRSIRDYSRIQSSDHLWGRRRAGGQPGEKAGIKAGDIVVAIDGKKVETQSDLRRELFRKKPGDTVSVEVVREGKRLTFSVTLIELRGGMPLMNGA